MSRAARRPSRRSRRRCRYSGKVILFRTASVSLAHDSKRAGCARSGRKFLLQAEHAAATIGRRRAPLGGDQLLDAGTARSRFQATGLVVEPFDRAELLVAAEPGLLHRLLQHADGFVVDADRNGKGMAVLAAMRQREARRIGKAIG